MPADLRERWMLMAWIAITQTFGDILVIRSSHHCTIWLLIVAGSETMANATVAPLALNSEERAYLEPRVRRRRIARSLSAGRSRRAAPFLRKIGIEVGFE